MHLLAPADAPRGCPCCTMSASRPGSRVIPLQLTRYFTQRPRVRAALPRRYFHDMLGSERRGHACAVLRPAPARREQPRRYLKLMAAGIADAWA